VPAAKQLRDLSGENARLKQLLAERDLEVAALKALVQKLVRVAQQRDRGGLERHIAAGRAHGDADIRLCQGRR